MKLGEIKPTRLAGREVVILKDCKKGRITAYDGERYEVSLKNGNHGCYFKHEFVSKKPYGARKR